jgi:hypothetical protein
LSDAPPLAPAPRVLHNPLACRQKAGFPMIGKYFSNGWKIPSGFPIIEKKFSALFQRLENFSVLRGI